MHSVASVCLFVCVCPERALTYKILQSETSSPVRWYITFKICRSSSYAEVIRSRSLLLKSRATKSKYFRRSARHAITDGDDRLDSGPSATRSVDRKCRFACRHSSSLDGRRRQHVVRTGICPSSSAAMVSSYSCTRPSPSSPSHLRSSHSADALRSA